MNQSAADISAIVTVYLFNETPGINSARVTALRHLVEFALLEGGGCVNEPDIIDAVELALRNAYEELSEDQLRLGLEEARRLGRIEAKNGTLTLESAAKAEILAARKQFTDDAKHFNDHLNACLEDALERELDAFEQALVGQKVQEVIVETARRNKSDFERELSSEVAPEGSPQGNPLDHLRQVLSQPAELFEHGNVGILVQAVVGLFSDLDDECRRYVRALYNKVFYHHLLHFDPRVQQALLDSLAATKLFLDTNVALDYLLQVTSEERATARVIDLAFSLGVQLFVTPVTLEELRGQIQAAEYTDIKLAGDRRVERVVAAMPNRLSPFYRAFLHSKSNNSNINWQGFIAPYQDLEALLLQRNVLVEQTDFDGIRSHEDYARVWSTLRSIRLDSVSDKVVDHDSENFLYIHLRRNRGGGTPLFGPAFWLITRDHNLRTLELALHSRYTTPHSKPVDQWAGLLLPLQHLGGCKLDDYIGHLLTTGFGITPSEQGIDPVFLSRLRNPGIDLDTILALDPKHAAEVIVGLQENAEARELVEQLDSGEPIASRAAGRLVDLTFETVVEKRDEAERKAREALHTVSALRDANSLTTEALQAKQRQLEETRSELTSAQLAVATLEKRIVALESEFNSKRTGIMARLLRMIPRPRKGEREGEP